MTSPRPAVAASANGSQGDKAPFRPPFQHPTASKHPHFGAHHHVNTASNTLHALNPHKTPPLTWGVRRGVEERLGDAGRPFGGRGFGRPAPFTVRRRVCRRPVSVQRRVVRVVPLWVRKHP